MKLRLALRRQSMDKIEASVRLLSSPQFQVDASSQEPRTVSQPDPAQLRGRPRLGGKRFLENSDICEKRPFPSVLRSRMRPTKSSRAVNPNSPGGDKSEGFNDLSDLIRLNSNGF